jgi:triphosphatase
MSSDNGARANEPGTHKDTREIEWQLASADLSPVRRWLSEHRQINGLTLHPDSTVQIHDTYFDTDDWRIHRAGYALRIRTEDGRTEATLKGLHSAREDVADRRELSESLSSAQSESILSSSGPVGRRVHAVSGAHALVPLFEVRTSREKFAVRQADQADQLGEIALDETIICRADGSPRTTLRRVEVEAHTPAHKPLQTLVRSLRRECELSRAADTKYSQGLKAAGLAPLPAASLSPTAVHSSMRMDEAVFAGLRRYLAEWYQHEPAARLGDDPEELHDLRVAGRRIEALLRQFRRYLPESLLQIRPVFKSLRQVLGQARDLDVALGELDAFLETLTESERSALGPLQDHLSRERLLARARMLELLDSQLVQRTFSHLTQLLAQPAASPAVAPGTSADETAAQQPPAGGSAAVSIAPILIRARYRKLRKGADRLRADSSMAAYHAVRSQVKKLRYTLETVAPVYGRTGNEMLRALRRWQEKLGVQQDADVAGKRLRAFVDSPPQATSPETLFLMGRLAGHHAGAAHRARAGLPKAYRKVKQRWKRLREQFHSPTVAKTAEPLPEARDAMPADATAGTTAGVSGGSRNSRARTGRRRTADNRQPVDAPPAPVITATEAGTPEPSAADG